MKVASASSSLPLPPLPISHGRHRHHRHHPNSPPPPPPSQPQPKTLKLQTQKPQNPKLSPFLTIPLQNQNPSSLLKHLKHLSQTNSLDQSLTILDYLDQRNIPVNTTTYSALIAACIRSKSLSVAYRIETHVRTAGLDNNEFIRAKLVEMYASCGSFDDAIRVFEGCDDQRGAVYAWNALLRGGVVAGGRRDWDLVDVYGRMTELGVEMNEYSFSCLIKGLAGAGAGAGSLREGLKIHGTLIKNGWITSLVLRTCLIDLYSKCGRIGIANKVFEEVVGCDRDVVVWGAMIAGFAHNGVREKVVECVRLMRGDGLVMNSALIATVLPVLAELGELKLGKEVHGYAVKTKGYSEHTFVQSALVDMYCKCGDVKSGKRVFDGSKERTVVSWTALLSGYTASGSHERALKSVISMQQEGFRPDVVMLVTVLPACTKLRALKQGKEIHGYAVRNDMLNVPLRTSLTVMYSKCGALDQSRQVFKRMDQRNATSWTAMIDSLTENERLHEALDVFRSMQSLDQRPDSIMISRVLEICSKLKTLNLGKEIHGQVLKKNMMLSPFVSAGIMRMFARCGLLDKAISVFDMIPYREIITQTTMIEIYGHCGQFDKAISYFDWMVLSGSIPTCVTWRVVLSLCNQAGLADEAHRIFELMTQRFGVTPSEEHYSIMIQLLTRLDRIEEAEKYRLRSDRLDQPFPVSRLSLLS